jgi:threonine/homoserine/homoserine lactone efflux protein
VFGAIRLIGAAYLAYLGASSLWLAFRPGRGDHHAGGHASAERQALRSGAALRQGVISNLGNPKMAIFFSSLLPQFVAPGGPTFVPMLALGLVFVTMTIAWLAAYSAVIARAGFVLRRPRVRRTFDAVMGTILVAFGIRLAVAER